MNESLPTITQVIEGMQINAPGFIPVTTVTINRGGFVQLEPYLYGTIDPDNILFYDGTITVSNVDYKSIKKTGFIYLTPILSSTNSEWNNTRGLYIKNNTIYTNKDMRAYINRLRSSSTVGEIDLDYYTTARNTYYRILAMATYVNPSATQKFIDDIPNDIPANATKLGSNLLAYIFNVYVR